MTRRLLSHDVLTGTSTYHDYDHSSQKTFIETVQDVKPYIERAKRLAQDSSYKQQGIKNDWYHFASIPNAVIMKLKEEYNLDYMREEDLPMIEKVISRDFKYLLTVDKI